MKSMSSTPNNNIKLAFGVALLFLSLSYSYQQVQEFSFSTGFSAPNSDHLLLSLNGASELDQKTGILRLTNDTRRLIGHAFYPNPLKFKNSTNGSVFSFSTAFAFAIVPEYPKLGGHGLSFVISSTKELHGASPSQYLGLLNASDMANATNHHIFAIEFDTVQDFEFGDINDNHVGIDINSLVSNSSAMASYYDENGVRSDIKLQSGDTIQAWVDYDGDNYKLNVTISPSSKKPKTALISFEADLSPILEENMYVGFSASTGLLASSHYLMGWNFKLNRGAVQSLDLSGLPSLPYPKKKNTTMILATTFSAFVVFVTMSAIAGYLFYKIKNADVIEPWEMECGPHRFSYSDLKRATKGFRDKELLGFGGFGKVYKGVLPGSTGGEIAVKRVSHESRQGLREFVAEIASIGRLRHRNLVSLQGWCRRRGDLLLVYEYMPNGSLDKYLYAPEATQTATLPLFLSWPQRIRILRGVASALLYLHEEWEHVVLHRDIKASNVLFDFEFNGRLGDFGLAKLYEHGANPSTTRVVGTLGYLAPELTRTGRATTACDVFAFGALILEAVCGRRPIELKAVPEEMVLVDWAWEKWAQGNWTGVVDPRLEGEFDEQEAQIAVRVGLMCSHPAVAARPTMRQVVRYLEGGDVSDLPELAGPPAGEYEHVGFDDYVHSCSSSSLQLHSRPMQLEASR